VFVPSRRTQEFASANWIKEWTGSAKSEVENGTLAGPLASAQYNGKLYAAPKDGRNVTLHERRAAGVVA
jgi:ABC-type glycerol-3-phosphate transport system substrate-binding protein